MFIEDLAPFAVKHGQASGVLPSLIIAQGILESASGTSDLAVNANNLFGIKAGSAWTGLIYNKQTTEHRLDGAIDYPYANFRKYPSYERCIIDLCYKYTHGTGWEDHNRYGAILNQKDYKKATAAVYAAGYATDINYPAKLNKLIEQHELTKYDKDVVQVANEYIQDGGHGGSDPGASFNGHVEKVYTLEAAAYVNRRLNELGIKSLMTRTTDVALDSVKRTNVVKQSNAKVCLSHHFNAGGGDGTETIHSINSDGKLATLIAKSIAAAGVKFRRVFSRKGTNGDFYYMHRLTGSVQTVIVEYEFLDGPNNAKLKDKAFREKLYEATVKAVCEYENVTYKADASTGTVVPPKEDVEVAQSLLNSTGRKDARELIKKAVAAGIFQESHLAKVDSYTDVELISYSIAYVNRTAK